MSTAVDTSAFERSVEPLIRVLPRDVARRIVDFRPDPKLQDRIDALGAKANEGTLTTAELAEYDGYIQANDFIAILQAEARRLLASRNAS
ncbi:MAG: hypothetical protein HYS13_12070 [Planctomycetia bacterium]|nr:hypothetical protein [Planctomycetia bacterium]